MYAIRSYYEEDPRRTDVEGPQAIGDQVLRDDVHGVLHGVGFALHQGADVLPGQGPLQRVPGIEHGVEKVGLSLQLRNNFV